ncbi:MAG: hypothetical protein A2Y62_10260 [Candidatus Fischerbacteria bacterium RBG_13_37_8]|uniref:FtsK domain-containing protein n=1 Tax=Candidatus Fischerbacteria bacterium RBG_13_37_8 TaxID=1817863 RepID=A0A1F5VXZ7_9BACT|nr:MAG: hypothetical protein A2Y62_10260 [Candidatus Fischerbacteria bacterium RBG_13_37_8]
MNERSLSFFIVKEIAGLILFGIGIAMLLSIYSHDPFDPSLSSITERQSFNYIGIIGSYASDILISGFGLGSYAIAILIMLFGLYVILKGTPTAIITKITGFVLFILALSILLQITTVIWPIEGLGFKNTFQLINYDAGGIIGRIFAGLLTNYLNKAGAIIFLLLLLVIGFLLITHLSISRLFQFFWKRTKESTKIFSIKIQKKVEMKKKEKSRKKVAEKHAKVLQEKITKEPSGPEPVMDKIQELPQEPKQLPLDLWEKSGRFMLPPITLLNKASEEIKTDLDEIKENKLLIEDKLAEFAISGKVVEMHPGPVITVYEFKPDPGIKFSRITALGEDLAMALKAESIRIDRIPGAATIGIEVPNNKRETIFLRDILESDLFTQSKSKLTIALGKYSDGSPMVSDLQAMPHLLIAGVTGSGKSVAINSLICSTLYKATPDEVKFILIDPKRVELKLYDKIPHLLVPVIWEAKQAANALKWLVKEMVNRHKKLAEYNVRNIAQYNTMIETDLEEMDLPLETKQEMKPLHYITLIIDELADLMMLAQAEVEESIQRLAQMARAVGIHLILATQRPSVDVITGVIKANFPCRISFKVSTRVDSRTVLDVTGAEQLLGKGDMLFIPPGMPRLLRIHGSYISEKEIHRLVNFWNRQMEPQYIEEILLDDQEKTGFSGEKDPLFDEAVEIVVAAQQGSISLLQRRLKIGFGRAARLIDQMEASGVVGPAYGSKPREVLIKRSE